MLGLIIIFSNDAAGFGGNFMKQFFFFLGCIFLGMFLLLINKNNSSLVDRNSPVLRIFATSSFAGQWGPGPELKKKFEKTCNCKVEFVEVAQAGLLLQRLKLEASGGSSADLVLSLDQFDLQKALFEVSWNKLNITGIDFLSEFSSVQKNDYFVPYDWGVLTLITRNADFIKKISSMDDILLEDIAKKTGFQDPLTSSPGKQFLWWVFKLKGERDGYQFLKKVAEKSHSFSGSWSQSIGFFNKKQLDAVWSYTTSPLYYQLEEKSNEVNAVAFKEKLPMQVEFVGVPKSCSQCELAAQFINMMLSVDSQKIIMTKNYMLPVIRGVADGTPFAKALSTANALPFEVPNDSEIEHIMQKWSEIRHDTSRF